MSITAPTRRGFLAGLLGVSVIAVLPKAASIAEAAPTITSFEVTAPDGWTYQWVASHVMGEPTPLNVQARVDNGWTFVPPADHPTIQPTDIAMAIDSGGLILMQKETRLIEQPKPHPMAIPPGFFQDNRRTFQGSTTFQGKPIGYDET